jgi:YVTN family beta-propeller protein
MDRAGIGYLAVLGVSAAAMCAALVAADPRGTRPPGGGGPADVPSWFVNWETGHVHPMDLTPDGSMLLVVNTADNRLEVFSLVTGSPVLLSEIPVGLDPISVRARSNAQAWVVNNISDSVSVVDLVSRNVIATLKTLDEPSDVVFAGTPLRAFVSCSQANAVQVFDPANLAAAPATVAINGEDPRALAVSPDGQTVYAAIFNSGNASTILGGGLDGANVIAFPPNVVNSSAGPYNGQNPPANSGTGFSPAIAPGNLSTVPRVGLVVKKDTQNRWMDDNNHDWTDLVSGTQSSLSGRPQGWDMPDRDLAVIDASGLSVGYARSLMNINMALGVNPATGTVGVVGIDGINEIRFEPNVKGRFMRVKLAMVDPASLGKTVKDLNPHLTYAVPTVAQPERDKSLGDPRGIVYNAAGTRGYITGMGSNNVIVVNSAGDRAGLAQTIAVGEGPTGLALDEQRGRVYVLNRFAASISVINTATESVVATVPFFDPTPAQIKVGRKHLYDTRKTSGLGQGSCASCHIDGRNDRLAWDLGHPGDTIKQLTGQNLGAGIPGLAAGATNPPFAPWHPMKGPMTTQTLQDIIGHEPLHWRGDRAGIEEFNGAFVGLLGDDVQLTPTEMQEFEDFLATITFPPNPFRNFDNTMPATLPLPGHYASGVFAGGGGLAAGQPLPPGRPNLGMTLYRDTGRRICGDLFACVTCHTLPTGAGTDMVFSQATQTYSALPAGPMGERHHMLVSVDGSTNRAIKTPHLRNAYLKVGFELTQLENNAGFGFLHDGSVDSLTRFVTEPVFGTANDQEAADLVAFLLCFSGSDLPPGLPNQLFIPPGTPSKDVPASVGLQTTLVEAATAPPAQLTFINSMIIQAQTGKVGLVVKGVVQGEQRGFMWTPVGFQSDRQSQNFSTTQLQAMAHAGSELTYTIVPKGTETRIGVDRDQNGVFDRDQADLSCYANCDGSHSVPLITANDFVCFLTMYAAGNPQANCDGSTVQPILTANDFTCFITQVAAGCP